MFGIYLLIGILVSIYALALLMLIAQRRSQSKSLSRERCFSIAGQDARPQQSCQHSTWDGAMSVEQFESIHGQEIFEWRYDEFRRLGFDIETSISLADSREDLYKVRCMIRQGCPVETATEILT